MMHLGHGVMRPALRAEPVGTREEIRLEDRLQHQLQGRLDHPVGDGRDTQAAHLAVRLGDHPLPHRQRAETAVLQFQPQPFQEHPGTHGQDVSGRPAVHPRRPRALVTPHANPRHQKERGIADKVEQVIEPAMRIFTSPAVQLGLDLQYPPLGLEENKVKLRITGIHRRSSWHSILLRHWPAGPLRPAAGFPGLRDGSLRPRLLRSLRPSRIRQPTAGLPAAGLEARKGGRTRLVPTFTLRPFDKLGTQLCPGSIAHGYAAGFHRGLPTGETTQIRS